LFGIGGNSVTNNFNINGSIQAGAVAIGGNSANLGNATFRNLTPQTVELLKSKLSAAAECIAASELEDSRKSDVLSEIDAAKADPSPSKLKSAVEIVENLGKLAGAGIALGSTLSPILCDISRALGFG
jgi:hypothetical protein